MAKTVPVAINGKFILAALEGMPRVAREITSAFDDLIKEEKYRHLELCVYAPRGARDRIALKNIEVREIGWNQGALWEQIDLPLHVGNSYCIHFTGTAPLILKNGCVVIHDAQFFSTPQSHGLKSRILYGFVTPIVARRYKTIVTVSQYALKEILNYNICKRSDVHLIPNSGDHVRRIEPDYGVINTLGLKKNQFMLSNSYVHKHKNVKTLFDAIDNNPDMCAKLVLFGSSTRESYKNFGIDVPDGVHFLGRISDQQMVALIEYARMFLFPSTTEGFGLPPLEAMTLGCPTICSLAGAMPEICSDGALYASPQDPEDWRRQIDRLWNSDEEWQYWSEAGLRQSSLYSWRRSGEKYLDLICESVAR